VGHDTSPRRFQYKIARFGAPTPRAAEHVVGLAMLAVEKAISAKTPRDRPME